MGLNQAMADQIRIDHEKGGITLKSLAKKYGATPNAVYKVVGNLTWTNGGKKKQTGINVGQSSPEKDRALVENGFCKDEGVWEQLLYGKKLRLGNQ